MMLNILKNELFKLEQIKLTNLNLISWEIKKILIKIKSLHVRKIKNENEYKIVTQAEPVYVVDKCKLQKPHKLELDTIGYNIFGKDEKIIFIKRKLI